MLHVWNIYQHWPHKWPLNVATVNLPAPWNIWQHLGIVLHIKHFSQIRGIMASQNISIDFACQGEMAQETQETEARNRLIGGTYLFSAYGTYGSGDIPTKIWPETWYRCTSILGSWRSPIDLGSNKVCLINCCELWTLPFRISAMSHQLVVCRVFIERHLGSSWCHSKESVNRG